jgi:peptide/nickel transport system permease protein
VLRFVALRILQMIPVFVGISLVMFVLVRVVPGDPAVVALNVYATPERVTQLRAVWGLDKPILVQYGIFLSQLLHGDLGYSYFYRQPTLVLVLERLGPELFLILYVVVLTLLVAIPLGALAATHREGAADNLVRALMIGGLSLPAYWVGIILLLVFGIWIPIFPVGGYGGTVLEHLRSLFLPATTIALGLTPLVIRALRASMIETLEADHVDMARSKGLPRFTVLRRHVFRPALIPAVTVLGINVGLLIGGTVIVEFVFGIPGLGQLMITAISTRDYPTVVAVTLAFAVFVMFVNLLTDVLVAFLDPRARAAMAG